jgi:hypothetical protein
MNDDEYFALDFLSTSRLGVIKCLRDNVELTKFTKESKDFGKQFHQAGLEREKYLKALGSDPAYHKNKFRIAEMIKVLKENTVFCEMMNAPGFVEYAHTFQEPRYGLDFKIKMDKYIQCLFTILDLKSTACKTMAEFLESLTTYGYHRQGALYLDGTGMRKFIIIGVTKSHPYKTYTVIWNQGHELIERGRMEYEELTDHYLTMPVKPDFKRLMD